jgi:hypothetical protein
MAAARVGRVRVGAVVVTLAVGVALAGGSVLAGCGGTPAGIGTQMTDWARSTGFTATLARLRGDLGNAGRLGPGKTLRTVCDALVTDALNAHEQLPAPDHQLTGLLDTAYAAAGSSGRDCFDGAGGDGALLARAATERTDALAGLVRAEARYDAVTSTLPGSSS